jgi:hypothetical protein
MEGMEKFLPFFFIVYNKMLYKNLFYIEKII